MKNQHKTISLLLALLLCLSSCAKGGASDTDAQDTAGTMSDSGVNSSAADGTPGPSGNNNIDEKDVFSSRDLSGDYDADAASRIELNGDLTITDGGVYILTGKTDGSVIVDADKSEKVQLVLAGVEITAHNTAALYVKSADKVFVTLDGGTENTLSSVGEFAADGDVNVDGALFARDDITINGTGSLTVESDSGHGIVGKDEVTITGGTISVTSKSNAIDANDIVAIADGTLTLTSDNDGIHVEDGDDDITGNVLIAGGSIHIACADDGIHAGGNVAVKGGDVVISKSHEGIEGATITVSGGSVDVTAEDDGFNAADGSGDMGGMFGGGRGGMGRGLGGGMSEPPDIGPGGTSDGTSNGTPDIGEDSVYILISGGTVHVNAGGDGLDSNGSLYISGGVTYVDGPENSGNGALDFASSSSITGGTVVAVGASGMAETFGASSTQCSIMYNFTSSGRGDVTLRDKNGNVIVSFSPSKTYNSVVISAPELSVGETYTLTACGQTVDVELTSVSTSNGGGMGSFGGMGGFGGFGGGPGGGRGHR